VQKFRVHIRFIGAIVLLVSQFGLLYGQTADAAQITARKLTLVAGATDQGSKPGGVVKHQFDFTLPTTGSMGSIKFQYCTTAGGTCILPTGLLTTSATLGIQTGATGFTINNTTNGTPYITRSAASVTGPQVVQYRLDNITNPTTTNSAFYVRISTYLSTDITGSSIDTGNVAASTATQIVLTGTMPESLIFCTGGLILNTGGVPDCSTASSGSILFNQLFSPTDTATASSQMAASTNAGSGYAISVYGTTLASGANTIAAMTTSGPGVRGTKQFGMNLKANTVATSNPIVGSEIAPISNGTNYRGEPLIGYSSVDNFKFNSGDSVADSANGGAGGTDIQTYTASYIANVPGSQPAGTYTTTLTYICTPTF
jgi:hypothetical protein